MNGKTVLITGAARGIGADSARQLAAKGANDALGGLEPEELDRVAAQCGRRGLAIEADVTDRDAIAAAVARTVDRFGGIDAVFANAGIGVGGMLDAVDEPAFERVIEVKSVKVDGDTASAQVRSTASNQEPSDDTIKLVKVDGKWRIASLAS